MSYGHDNESRTVLESIMDTSRRHERLKLKIQGLKRNEKKNDDDKLEGFKKS